MTIPIFYHFQREKETEPQKEPSEAFFPQFTQLHDMRRALGPGVWVPAPCAEGVNIPTP